MLHIAICDDLSKDRIKLQNQVEEYFAAREERVSIMTFSSGDELVAAMEDHNKYHIIFMDIYMEGISGVEASRCIRRIDSDSAIIFTTTSPDHAMAGYEVRVSDYLLKPFNQEDVARALDWVMERLPRNIRMLEIISNRVHRELPISDIVYIEVLGRESRIHMGSGEEITTNQPLRSLEQEVGTSFIRCHKSYLVNPCFVRRLVKGSVLLTDGGEIPMGTEMEANCRDVFFEWTFRRTWERI